MPAEELQGRVLLNAWQKARPRNYYEVNPWLKAWVRTYIPEYEEEFQRFGELVHEPLEQLVAESEARENLPALRHYDGMGNPIEEVVFHPSYHAAGRIVYENGLVFVREQPGHARHQGVLFYLLTHLGEMGHACPVTCTTGLALALKEYGSPELKGQFLPRIFARSYEDRFHASQFLTEVQSGSDVGANLVEAVPDPEAPERYRIYGEKWFCSVADAHLFFVTARPRGAPPGMKGLGAFLVPRHTPEGKVNQFHLRRLKEKLGTRGLATGEIEFQGSLAYPIGELSQGYKIALGVVLNTSRFMNALGSCGGLMMAYLEALSYASYRQAFSQYIIHYPLVQERLALLKSEAVANMLLTFWIGEVLDRMELGKASAEEEKTYRFLVNANKYFTSLRASGKEALEVLGGNGTIETFTLLPRLYRDGIVMESWEGAHNILCLQVYRDSLRYNLLPAVKAHFTEWLASARVPFELISQLKSQGEQAFERYEELLADPERGVLHCRRVMERILRYLQLAYLLRLLSEPEFEPLLPEGKAIAEFLLLKEQGGYDPVTDPQYHNRLLQIIGRDVAMFRKEIHPA